MILIYLFNYDRLNGKKVRSKLPENTIKLKYFIVSFYNEYNLLMENKIEYIIKVK